MRTPFRRRRSGWFGVVLCTLSFLPATHVIAQSDINWRRADSVSLGQEFVRIDVSSTRRVRVATRSKDGRLVVASDLDPAALIAWSRSVRLGLAARIPGEFENAIAVQPAVKATDSTGYVITIADSVGSTHAMFATLREAEAMIAALDRSARRAENLANEELAQAGPLPPDSGTSECERIQDSVFTRVPNDRWPIARPMNRPTHVPRPPVDASPNVPVNATINVLPNGALDSASFKVTGTTDARYMRTVLEFLSSQKWITPSVSGCPVPSRAGLMVMAVGEPRRR